MKKFFNPKIILSTIAFILATQLSASAQLNSSNADSFTEDYACANLSYYMSRLYTKGPGLSDYSKVQSTDANTLGEVSRLQAFLKESDYIASNIFTSGRFGPVTTTGLKNFQKDYGFSQTGATGPRTIAKIRELSCGDEVDGTVADKNTSGVSYANIRLFVRNTLNEAGLSESAKAQKLFNQMTASNVSAADIVFAFKDTDTKYTSLAIETFLAKRNQGATTTSVSGSVSVSLAPNQPFINIAAGQISARIADFTFTGSGTITSISLARTGVSDNTTLSKVYLYDNDNIITNKLSVSADNTITFNNPSGIFSVNGSRTISVRADILGGTSNQSVGLVLTGLKVSGEAAINTNLAGPQFSIGAITGAVATASGVFIPVSTLAPNWSGLTVNYNQLVPGGEAVVVARNSGGSTLQSVDLSIVNTFYQTAFNGGWITPNTNTDLDKFSVVIGSDSIGEFIKLRLLSRSIVSPYGVDGPIEFSIGVNLKSADKVNRTVQFKVIKSAGPTWELLAKNASGVSASNVIPPKLSPNWIGSTINMNQLVTGGAPVIVARNAGGLIAQSVEIVQVNTLFQDPASGAWVTGNTNNDISKFNVTISGSSISEFINLYKVSEPNASPYPNGMIRYEFAVKINSTDGVYRSVNFTVTKPATQSVTTVVGPTNPNTTSNGVSYSDIRAFILDIFNNPNVSDADKPQRVFDKMTAFNVSVADIVFAFKDTEKSSTITTQNMNDFLANRNR